jgi:ankyrin repeat protein
MSDALPLPPHPDVRQYRKLAKDLQHACRSGDPGAIRGWATRWLARLRRQEITEQPQRAMTAEAVRNERQREGVRIEQRWQAFGITAERRARCLLADAQFFVAREHGFASWPKFVAHLEKLAQRDSSVAVFEEAADAIIRGDARTLRLLLQRHPGLARARSTREHRSTLLHYVSANGVEDFRQKTPPNIVDITNMLLDAGADVDAESEAYGGGSTTLGLAATSLHPEAAGVQIELLETLLKRGAQIDKPGLAGNGHGAIWGCLANGQGEAARFFADRGASMSLEDAAGVGRLDVVRTYFNEKGALINGATPRQLEAGFLYACGYGRSNVVEYLLDKGVDPNVHNKEGQTGLHWASYGPHVEVASFLLQAGADVGLREHEHGGTPLEWAVYGWSQCRDADDRARACTLIALLVRAGGTLDPRWFDANEERRKVLEMTRMAPDLAAALKR